jgi:hypothetical protein
LTTIDEALALYDASEFETARAWRELVIATVGLGAALARFTNALDACGAAVRTNER